MLTLLLARFYLPTEASDRGLTLWLAVAAFLLLAGRMWRGSRILEPFPLRRPTLPEWGLILLIGGHLISAAGAIWSGADCRAVLNHIWEWTSIGAMVLLLRDTIRSRALLQLLTPTLLTVAVTLSCLGCWQHFVWYPANARMAQRLQQLETQANLSEAEREERQRLIAEIPDWETSSETGQKMLFARLAESREPIAAFALANTFAGLLIVLLLVAVDQTFLQWHANRSRWLLLTIVALTACNLLLTKSRTAYAGAALGITLWGILQLWRSQPERRSQLVKGLLIGSGLTGAVFVIAFLSGSLDREVITEAFKSFRYRIEYWTATLQMLRDHPLLGSGPGNFRQMYLQYKLPGSSEEILDPHNLVLELWASGGLLALSGAGLMIASLIRSMWAQRFSQSAAEVVPYSFCFRMACGAAPVVLVLLGRGAFEGWLDPTLGWLVLVSIISSMLLLPRCQETQVNAWMAAWMALSLHLCGAGGIGMPAIVQVWLLVWMVSLRETYKTPDNASDASSQWMWLGGIAVSLLLAFGCLWTGVIPVISMNHLLAQARVAQRTDSRQAVRLMTLATEVDSLSPDPWQDLAMAHMGHWKQSPRWNADSFTQAIEAQQAAIKRDPRAGKRYHLLGQAWGQKFAHSHNDDEAEQGIAAYRTGITLYPNFAPLHADLAVLLNDANRPAVQEAQRAIELDDLNRTAGHTDKLLPEEQRTSLEAIVAKGL